MPHVKRLLKNLSTKRVAQCVAVPEINVCLQQLWQYHLNIKTGNRNITYASHHRGGWTRTVQDLPVVEILCVTAAGRIIIATCDAHLTTIVRADQVEWKQQNMDR